MNGFKVFVALALLLAATGAFTAEVTPLVYQFPVMGTPTDNTFSATLTDAAQSIQTLATTAGITWYMNGQTPSGVLISVETFAARLGTANISAGGVGHVVATGSPWRIPSAGFLANTYLCNSVAGDNAVVQITLER